VKAAKALGLTFPLALIASAGAVTNEGCYLAGRNGPFLAP
jgi:hypothetical protein